MITTGYESHSTQGSMRVEGAAPLDEVFTSHPQGSINVSAMWRDIAAGDADAAIHSVLLNDAALWALENKDLDRETLAKMTPDRAELPILVIGQPNDRASLIDGNHRVAFRHKRGDKIFLAWFFPESAWATYGVRIYLAAPTPPVFAKPDWILQTPAQLLARTIGTYAVRDASGRVVGMRDERNPDARRLVSSVS